MANRDREIDRVLKGESDRVSPIAREISVLKYKVLMLETKVKDLENKVQKLLIALEGTL